ncbi:actin [Anaeramoeba flamelloides]|uniref:Actin n=1 Tax=Anaeramoeba flamelloides TaxID=1746091 RepID=A0ABQ8Z3H6_9EUKA|nr:actin [Anaeramoeba flamelloides]
MTSPSLIIDNGSGVIKSGLSNNSQPTCVFQSFVGRMSSPNIQEQTFIGEQAEKQKELLKLRYPIERGNIENWEDMEKIWSYIYSTLNLESDQHPVLLSEPPLNPFSKREKMAEIFFETFKVPSLYLSLQQVLSLYSAGKTTGIVLDSGEGVTHAVPIFGGFAIPHAISKMDIAGKDVTKQLRILLRKAGYSFTSSYDNELVRILKENTCQLSDNLRQNQEKDLKKQFQPVNYQLPNSNEITIQHERFIAPEILFDPEMIDSDENGIHKLIKNSIDKSDLDLLNELYKNIVLSGGNTLIQGFGKRLLKELKEISPKNMKISISAPKNRKFSTWIGGSILVKLETYKKMLITNKDYKENGVKIINQKGL